VSLAGSMRPPSTNLKGSEYPAVPVCVITVFYAIAFASTNHLDCSSRKPHLHRSNPSEEPGVLVGQGRKALGDAVSRQDRVDLGDGF